MKKISVTSLALFLSTVGSDVFASNLATDGEKYLTRSHSMEELEALPPAKKRKANPDKEEEDQLSISTLERLPLDLLKNIVFYLETGDKKNLRLLNKHMARIIRSNANWAASAKGKDLVVFGEIFKKSNMLLKSLAIIDLDNSSTELEKITNILSYKPFQSLHELDLSGNTIGAPGMWHLAPILAKNTSIRVLNLHDIEIDIEGLILLTSALANNTTLHSLDLSDISIIPSDIRANEDKYAAWEAEDKGFKYIGLLIEKNKGLRALNLRRTGICGDWFKHIGPALEKNTTLQSLDLSYNVFDDEEAGYIGTALENNRSIKELYLRRFIAGCEVLERIAKALEKNITLQMLDLEDNGIGDGEMKNIIKCIPKALKINKSLKTLNLKDNLIEYDKLALFAEALDENTTLKRLYLGDNSITDEEEKEIKSILSQNNSTCQVIL